MIDRKIIGYFSMIFVATLCYALFVENEPIVSALVGLIYLVFALGVDKFKIDLKNKKIEIEDEHKN
jgi:hypothetical protein